MSRSCPQLFRGVTDSDRGDFQSLAARAQELGLEVIELPAERDVDTFEDLLAMWRERQDRHQEP